MMYKFAHIADCHLGAHRHPELKKIEFEAFKIAIRRAIDAGVDFIVIAGDLFHSNIPNIEVVKKTAELLRKLKENQTPVYAIYGSHDYSPTNTSMVDVLESAGLLIKVMKGNLENDKLRLNFFEDPDTGAKLTGLSARKMSLEESYYRILDRSLLEGEDAFKIFIFHSAISQLKPAYLSDMESIDLNLFPKGFDYYAGGHIHQRIETEEKGYGKIVYPGPLFGSYVGDLEANAKDGVKRGFYIVKFDEKLREANFEPIRVADYTYFRYNVTGENSREAMENIISQLNQCNVKDKLVMIKIDGELSSGRISDINIIKIRDLLMEKGARHVNINRHSLKKFEKKRISIGETSRPLIEKGLFKDTISEVDVSLRNLKARRGVKLALELLKILREEKKPNETRGDYEDRIFKDAIRIFSLDEMLEEGPL